MVVEIGPRAVSLIAQGLREGVAPRQACRLADEPVEGRGVVLELLAMRLLPLCPLGLGVAARIGRLGELADVLGGMEKVDQLAIRVLFEEAPLACRPIGNA
jgi:hypothetical protein